MKFSLAFPTATSVVIPSFQRHEEIVRAVMSVLAQTLPPTEVIVSNDGPDSEKGNLLASIGDDRVRYIEAPRTGHPSATRNYAIRRAKSDWIALLDDDDVWLPAKLEVQFAALQRSGLSDAILAGVEVVYSRGRQSYFRPARTIPAHLPVDQVLFCGYGGVHTSTLMAPKRFFEKYPFDEKLERHEDWAWMLRAGQELEVVVAPEVICERHLTPGEGVTKPGGYSFSKGWYEENKNLMSTSARSSFVADILSRTAAYDKKIAAIPWLLREIRSNSGLTQNNFARFLRPWILPTWMRRMIKERLFVW